ncbi:hypothetical protein N9Y70_02440 [Methylophilaceae bacterium]|nr:hypothetical protein [Methylophilaceae bacterium]
MNNQKANILILSFAVFFLFITGIFENLIGVFPACIGVCNNPILPVTWDEYLLFGNLGWISFLWISIVLVIIYLILHTFKKFPKLQLNNALALFTILFLSITSLYITSWGMDSDDRWLEYRISKNVLDYGLYYWNPYELINISTPTFWPYIASQAHVLTKIFPISWELAIKILGLFIYCVTAIYIYRINLDNKNIRNYIFIGVITYFPFLYWSISGLEAVLACLWVVLIIERFYAKGATSFNWILYCSIIFIRPEFIIAPFISMICNLIIHFKIYKFKNLLKPFVILFIIVLLWMGINYFIWGDWAPSPYYIKSLFHSPFTAELSAFFKVSNATVHFLSSLIQSIFLAGSFLFLMTTSFNFIFNRLKRKAFSERATISLILFFGFLGVAGYHILSGYMHMSYIFRYFLPENIAFIIISGIVFQEQLSSKNIVTTLNLKAYIAILTIIQLSVVSISGFYSTNAELSLTRAKHRDAFSGASYSVLMSEWREYGELLYSIKQPGDRLWMMNGTNIAAGAISDMYALDGYYTPLKKSKFDSIRKCKDWECAKYFNYILVREDSNWDDFLSNLNYIMLRKSNGIILLKNKQPEY